MKKIAFITDAWLPQVNGVVNTYINMNAIIKKDYKIKVLHPGMFKSFSYPWYKEIKLAYNTKNITEEFFTNFNPDIIHIATEGPVGMSGKNYCKRNNLKYTTSFHTRFPEYIEKRIFLPRKIGYYLLRGFHQDSQNILVPTLSMRQVLENYNFKNVKIWSRGVNTKLFNPSKRTKNNNHQNITYVGRVAIEKNIEAFLNLQTNIKKIVVGDGPEINKFKYKYPEVNFVGLKKGNELAKYYANADVLVFPSKTDTFGNVILESLASGTPVAAFPVTGPKDILKGSSVDTLDENLEISVKKALKIKRDKCREFAEQFTWGQCAQQFMSHVVEAK